MKEMIVRIPVKATYTLELRIPKEDYGDDFYDDPERVQQIIDDAMANPPDSADIDWDEKFDEIETDAEEPEED